MPKKKTAEQLEDYRFESKGEGVGRHNSAHVGTRVAITTAEKLEQLSEEKGVSKSKILRELIEKEFGK